MPPERNIIGDVTSHLEQTLTAASLTVSLDSPASLQGGDGQKWSKVNLYLYQVLENPFTKNQGWLGSDPRKQQYPPLALNLYYLLTPFASDAVSAHGALSHAMRVLYEKSIAPPADLPESLRLSIEQLAVVLMPMKLEELTRIWNALQSPYRLSVCYEVRIVLIESQIERQVRRVETKIDGYVQR